MGASFVPAAYVCCGGRQSAMPSKVRRMTGMTTPARSEPAVNAAERPMLEGWLGHHRHTLALKCAGLTDAQLREASAAPSELSLLGLVRYMAEVERG